MTDQELIAKCETRLSFAKDNLDNGIAFKDTLEIFTELLTRFRAQKKCNKVYSEKEVKEIVWKSCEGNTSLYRKFEDWFKDYPHHQPNRKLRERR